MSSKSNKTYTIVYWWVVAWSSLGFVGQTNDFYWQYARYLMAHGGRWWSDPLINIIRFSGL